MASVVGIDLGNLSSKIGVARHRGIDIITNEVSNRSTPSLVSFTPRQRLIGESAKTAETSNFKNTVGSLKRMIGRSPNDPEIETEEKKFINAQLVDVAGQVGVKVNYLGEQEDFSYTQLVGAYLGKLRDTAAAELKQAVSDVVIAVPGFYTDIQRRALIDACQIAGLNPLRLINDTTATALGYGITKSDLPESQEEARHVVFVDVGHSCYSVAVVAFSKGQLVVKGVAHDRNFGGRNFDYALVEHFAKEFNAKYKIDCFSSPKTIFRLTAGCERLKKVLSANTEAPINVESLAPDIDANGSLTRAEFEAMIAPLLDRFQGPLDAALKQAGLTKEQVHSIELVGGSTRVPAIKERLQAYFGKPLSFTLNQDEAVARGATFACASLSPVFRVREFAVQDITPYPIQVGWEKEPGNPDEDTELIVFKEGNDIPSTKLLTFYRQGPFSIDAKYHPSADISKGTNPEIGRFTVKNVEKTASGDLACVKVKTRLNLHGILSFEGAYQVEEVEKEEVIVTGEGEDKKEEKKMVKKLVRKGDYPVIAQYNTIPSNLINDYQEAEGKMAASDKLVMETEERKNALEEYVYETRGKLDDRYKLYAQASEKETLLAGLTEAEDWLYTDEGEDAPKSAYVAKLDALKKIGDPIALRWRENEARPKAAAQLREVCNDFLSKAQNGEEQYSHISDEDKQKVIEKCANTLSWLENQLARQAEKPKNVNPVVTSEEMNTRREDVQYTSASIMNRPKPRAKVETPGTQTPKDDKMDQDPPAEQQEMDID
ncbi:putative heat shock protein [Cutaneotrichosporon oleaginosum]|uniref:Putative heat shock protein n=1 Tax=Cutaneotrichosporon oleaginosum TaxID=879819 RepID=A0A0J0XH02_9TREE|nr:putative heat shock protein [Cutaneotrichosporon oleaginosum]KLT40356.1 putative heat shock protein [Cutaneotrichosporon oleaginosum]